MTFFGEYDGGDEIFEIFVILLLNLAKLTMNFRAHMREIPVFGVFRGLVWAVG